MFNLSLFAAVDLVGDVACRFASVETVLFVTLRAFGPCSNALTRCASFFSNPVFAAALRVHKGSRRESWEPALLAPKDTAPQLVQNFSLFHNTK
jgi:hypothetical protein